MRCFPYGRAMMVLCGLVFVNKAWADPAPTVITTPEEFGTDAAPFLLSTAPSQQPISINMLSPGTPGVPGPATAHHAIDGHCTKQNFFSSTATPGIGEMDCLNLVVRQDGVNPDLTTNGGDAGDVGAILADVQSTLRAQNFTGYMEEHTSVVDTRTNTTPYYMDMQEASVMTAGHPNDDGSQSQMRAWFAALIDGHGSGLTLVEQVDASPTAGKIGHGVIDSIIDVGAYDGSSLYHVDRLGATQAVNWGVATDNVNVNLELGSALNPYGQFATSTPYIDFNGMDQMQNVRLISDDVGQLSILTQNTRNYIFNRQYAVFLQPTTFTKDITVANVHINGGIIFPTNNGTATVMTVDPTGTLHIAGTSPSAAVDIDAPMNPSSVASTGPVSGAAVSSATSITYGTKAGNGNHPVTEESLIGYTAGGPVALTPAGGGETATNNIGVIQNGGAKVDAEIVCQNGTDMASWTVKSLYMIQKGSLHLMGVTRVQDIPATPGASTWQAIPTVDGQFSAPEIIMTFGQTTANVSCTAKAEIIASRT